MAALWTWITDLGNSKIVALILFMTTFIAILIYVFGSPRRSRRFEQYRYIPLQDDDDPRDPHYAASVRSASGTGRSSQEVGEAGSARPDRQGHRKS